MVHYRVHKSLPLVPMLSQTESIPLHPIFLKTILILSSHLRLGLRSGFPSKSYTHSFSCPCVIRMAQLQECSTDCSIFHTEQNAGLYRPRQTGGTYFCSSLRSYFKVRGKLATQEAINEERIKTDIILSKTANCRKK
jgi:hypothetical protein